MVFGVLIFAPYGVSHRSPAENYHIACRVLSVVPTSVRSGDADANDLVEEFKGGKGRGREGKAKERDWRGGEEGCAGEVSGGEGRGAERRKEGRGRA